MVSEQSLDDAIVERVIEHYLASGDYNGLAIDHLIQEMSGEASQIVAAVAGLVERGRLTLSSERTDLNPYIRRLPAAATDVQLDLLRSGEGGVMCAYPTAGELDDRMGEADRVATPYSARLARGGAQLQPVFFEPIVLDRYMRDPRYRVDFSDYTGHISIGDAAYLDESFPERDKVSIQTFGIGYRPNGLRVVVVFLHYLAGLSPEHQRVWQAHEVAEQCRIIGDYLRNAFEGEFAKSISVYSALLHEQVAINELTVAAGYSPFFRETYERNRPQAYHPLLIPTLRAYLDFVAVLDKLLSENINIDFFPQSLRVPDDRGQAKGSIRLLEEWIRANWMPRGEDPIPRLIESLRRVRRERQRPAHRIEVDRYDVVFYEEQRRLVADSWSAVNALRQIFAMLPGARGVVLRRGLDLPVDPY
jgi:hypothetical protein